MAKKAAKKTAAKKGTKKAPPVVEKPEFGLDALAKEMKQKPATVRVKLRGAKVKRDGKFYNFGNAAGVKSMAKKLAA